MTGTDRPRKYWSDLKSKLKKEGSQLSDFIGQLKFQSIPSPKAEPFKLWLAQVASERLDEMQDPELTIDRALEQYLNLGYSEN